MKVLMSSLAIFVSLAAVLSADFAQANPYLFPYLLDSCDPPPDQPKQPPKK